LSERFPPIDDLIPHRGVMRLLDGVSAADATSIEALATVPAEAWYLDERGAMPAWIGIELMAQAIAALAGLEGRRQGRPPRPGVLLGTRAYRAKAGSFPRGERLRISVRLSDADESGFGAYACEIRGAAGPLAEATLKVFAPPDFAAFIQSAP
jgi:predicted hotdog family 3-hydroxylacyl-ACP dehydratase